jgi:D-3-phosphoglycerate dehydrogenase / 2-oxoglutarate reductase
MRIAVLEPEPMTDELRHRLGQLGEVVWGPLDDAALAEVLPGCEVLMVRLGRFIGPDLMTAAGRLRFIVSATTGLDHIDLAAASARGIRVVSLRDCTHLIGDVSATAELCWGLLLGLLRGIPSAVDHVRAGGWDRNRFWGTQLRGKRLGIVGFGRIGALVGGYGAAFGMDVVAHDRHRQRVAAPAQFLSLDEVMATSDVVSVHVTADPINRHLIDERRIALMKPGSVFINTSRGMIVDAAAVATAVADGRLGGAAVDVLEAEEHGTQANDPLLACMRQGGNVLITPHIGGATRDAIAHTEGVVVGVLTELLKAEAQ